MPLALEEPLDNIEQPKEQLLAQFLVHESEQPVEQLLEHAFEHDKEQPVEQLLEQALEHVKEQEPVQLVQLFLHPIEHEPVQLEQPPEHPYQHPEQDRLEANVLKGSCDINSPPITGKTLFATCLKKLRLVCNSVSPSIGIL